MRNQYSIFILYLGLSANLALADYYFYILVGEYWEEDTDVGISGINDRGYISGSVPVADGPGEACIWYNGKCNMIGIGWGGEDGFEGAAGISDANMTSGTNYDNVVVWEEGEFTVFDITPGCVYDNGGLISRNGEWIGAHCYSEGKQGDLVPTLFSTTNQTSEILQWVPGWVGAVASINVNSSGVVVGRVALDGEPFNRGWLWSDGVMVEVPNRLGGQGISLFSINEKGQIVGSAEAVDGYGALYINENGIQSIIGDGAAFDLNERGSAVGNLNFFSGDHACLYKDGETLDLTPYLPTEWYDSIAEHINNYGWIVGTGTEELPPPESDIGFGFLLVPIYPKGDYDGDEDVDLHDFGHFQECFAADPYIDGTLHIGCSVFDFDDDIDLDLSDYQSFQAAFTGAITSGW